MSDSNRAVVNLVPDDGEARRMRTIQVTVFEGDVRDDVEHFEPYGITSRVQDAPADGRGAEAIVIDLGGNSDHPVAIVVADRRYRVTGLAKGEVCIHDDQGQRITLKRDRILVEAPIVEVKSPDVRLGETADAAIAKWPALKTFMTDILAALTAATSSPTGGTLTFIPASPLPAVPADADGGTTKVTAK